MLGTIPVKKRVKILVQIDLDLEGNFVFKKVSTILSQRNIYESYLIDEFLTKFSTKLNITFKSRSSIWRFIKTFRIPLLIDIYKKRHKTDVSVCGFDFLTIFKKLDDFRKLRQFWNIYILPMNSIMEIFKINLFHVGFLKFSSIDFMKFKKCFIYVNFFIFSIHNRLQLKGRKVNFRRKKKEKKKELIKIKFGVFA